MSVTDSQPIGQIRIPQSFSHKPAEAPVAVEQAAVAQVAGPAAARWAGEPAVEPPAAWAAPVRAVQEWDPVPEPWEAAPAHPEEEAAVPVILAQGLEAGAAVPPWEEETWPEEALEWEAAARADRVREWEAPGRVNQAQERGTRAVRARAPEWDPREAGPRRAAGQWVANTSRSPSKLACCLFPLRLRRLSPLPLAEGSGTTLVDQLRPASWLAMPMFDGPFCEA